MIHVAAQTFGLWNLLALPATVSTRVRERVIPLLQSREIYAGIGETGMAEGVHKVINQIPGLESLYFFTENNSK